MVGLARYGLPKGKHKLVTPGSRKKVAFCPTGGTVAGVSYGPKVNGFGRQTRNYKVELSGEELIAKFPSISSIADVEVEDIMCLDTLNLGTGHTSIFAEMVFPYLWRDDIAGVVVPTGTDTMQYICCWLALMLRNLNKPIVVTGAIVPSDQDEAHVRRHLEDAIMSAAYSGINEVVVCFSGDENSTFSYLFRGTHAIKLRPQAYNAFDCLLEYPVARIQDSQITLSEGCCLDLPGEEPSLAPKVSNDVLLLTWAPLSCYLPAMKDLEEEGTKAIVINSCSGALIRNQARFDRVCEYMEAGILVGITTPSFFEYRQSWGEKDEILENLGLIVLGCMHYSKAYAKMAWAIGQAGGDLQKARDLMSQNIAFEMNNAFLQ